jgi:hypothetical protein
MRKHCCDMMEYYLQDEDDVIQYRPRFAEYVLPSIDCLATTFNRTVLKDSLTQDSPRP